jgi:hypothetical protein
MAAPSSGQCSSAASIMEAQSLVRRCAEPRPAGDSVKAAIRRASRRLDLRFTRTRDIWYGEARRIDAGEMDQLRRVALNAELNAGIEVQSKMFASRLPHSHPVFAELTSALRLLGSNVNASGNGLAAIHDLDGASDSNLNRTRRSSPLPKSQKLHSQLSLCFPLSLLLPICSRQIRVMNLMRSDDGSRGYVFVLCSTLDFGTGAQARQSRSNGHGGRAELQECAAPDHGCPRPSTIRGSLDITSVAVAAAIIDHDVHEDFCSRREGAVAARANAEHQGIVGKFPYRGGPEGPTGQLLLDGEAR